MANNAYLDAALAALSMGLCAIPAAGHTMPSNPKKPFGTWLKYQQQRPSPTDLENLYARHQFTTVGLVCGKISAGLECLDFDTVLGYQAFQHAAKTSELAPLIARIEAGYSEQSPKGVHLLYFCDGVDGSQKLNDELKIETRGEGGFVVIAPSSFADVDGRKQYQLKSGALASIARISPAERKQLHSFIDTLGSHAKAAVGPGICTLAAGKIAEGGRNNALLSLAGTMRSRGMSPEALAAALHAENKARCEPPLPDNEVGAIVRSVSKYQPGQSFGMSAPIDWKAPGPLPSGLPPVPPFDAAALLPAGLAEWVIDTAHRLQCPPDYAAVGLVVALSSVIGGRLCIRPKQLDTSWTVTPNLWGMVIGRPSTLKSPALAVALAPLKALDTSAQAAYEADVQQFQAAKMAHDLALAHVKKKVTTGSAAPQQYSQTASSIASVLQQQPAKPKRMRYTVNDATVEKLGEILSENPNGVLLFRDELKGFLADLDGEDNAVRRAFILQAWEGGGSYDFDRIGRGHIHIERTILSVLGSTQPGVIEAYLATALRGGVGDDGLMQRFQLAVYPDDPDTSTLVDAQPDLQAAGTVTSLFKSLSQLDPASVGAQQDNVGGSENRWYLHFTPEAQNIYNDWFPKLVQHTKRASHAAVASHLGKYRSLVPSLALIFHLAVGGGGAVNKAALHLAIGWAAYLKQHATRIYNYSTRGDALAALALGEALQAGKLRDSFSVRDLQRKNWSGLPSGERCQQAIEILAERNWLFVERVTVNGKTTERSRINPALIKK
ncbi:DUF3987 domain-containing protein [Burkholderia sp. R-69980]|uniref:DUF3987 domain-containing protein n=1 Tax=Paraburkholderia domus TaxID=2793075 RepID=UPI001911914E|nr:DUF3987 domain-containing protein [Paraburkholderia domus]MBK5119246.1 DUF3987 domain-containing protein [Burkholderia sp. R-69980]CAE6864602.1 hypothetical protein R75471_00422 [Paraburkholderia domus]